MKQQLYSAAVYCGQAIQARRQDLKKGGGGYFEKVRQPQATFTRIFIVSTHKFKQNQKFKRFFSPKTGNLQRKKKVFAEIQTLFQVESRHLLCNIGTQIPLGGCFYFFTKNRPQKHQKRAILHTLQANGGARAPPGYATEAIIQGQAK